MGGLDARKTYNQHSGLIYALMFICLNSVFYFYKRKGFEDDKRSTSLANVTLSNASLTVVAGEISPTK